jgi:CRP-like cAMP-binding protein
MLTIEKVLILRSVGIFSTIPEDSLSGIASIIDFIQVGKGDVIFEKGDIGTSMYIIINGAVEVQDSGAVITTLRSRDVFGEMAALDPEPRNATIVAAEDTSLFKLEQEALYELVGEYPDVARGIIQVLSQRLRSRGVPGKPDTGEI